MSRFVPRATGRPRRAPAAWALLTLAAVLAGGCRTTATVPSRPLDREIHVDGSERDWQGALAPLQRQQVTVGFLNDGDYLYVSLLSEDEALLRQVMRLGLTIWFDPEGGRERTVGLRFPLGLMAAGGPFEPGGRPGGGGPVEGAPRPGTGAGREEGWQRQSFEASMREVEVLRAGGEQRQRLPKEAVEGLAANASLQHGSFVYELRIPLQPAGGGAFGIGARPGQTIGVGFETPDIERGRMDGADGRRPPGGVGMPGEGPGGGGMPGMSGGGMRRGGRGMRGGEGPVIDTPLKAWLKVTLAAV